MRRAAGKNILLIDDDDDLRDIIHYALAEKGYTVRSYQGPENALVTLKEGKFIPDLVIVDQYMKNMTGGEFLEIKQEFRNPAIRNCPSIIISGSPHEVERSVPRHFYSEIFPKPLHMDDLSERIDELFSENSEKSPEF